MAITAAETFNTLTPPIAILATDVDRAVLAEAREGVYPMERVSHLPQLMLKRYFEWGSGNNSGSGCDVSGGSSSPAPGFAAGLLLGLVALVSRRRNSAK